LHVLKLVLNFLLRVIISAESRLRCRCLITTSLLTTLYQLEPAPRLRLREQLLDLPGLALSLQSKLFTKTVISLLVGLFLVVELTVLLLDGVEVDVSGQRELVLPVKVLVDPLELLLELLNVLLRMWVHLLED